MRKQKQKFVEIVADNILNLRTLRWLTRLTKKHRSVWNEDSGENNLDPRRFR